MNLDKLSYKYLFFILISSLFLFYSGHNSLLAPAQSNLKAFDNTTTLKFNPQPLPLLKYNLDPLQISSQSYLVMDLSSFTPIISYQPHKKMFPASTVKLATALVSFKQYNLDQKLIVNKTIDQELKMGLVKNEEITALNLLYGALVYSANDASYTLAENYPGGVPAFVKQMNLLAKKLNMKKTHFTNPIGFDNNSQYTTAYDLALLSNEFIQKPLLLNIVSTKSITVSDTKFEHFHYLTSVNQLLGEIPHLGGLKTGTTDKAGENFISFYRFNNKPVLIVLLNSLDRFEDTRIILDYINQSLYYQSI